MFINEIKDRLVAQGVGVYGTNIFISSAANIPAGDGPYLTLVDTGGSGPSRSHNGSALERPTLQLTARAKSQAAAVTMLRAAYTALGGARGLHNITLTGIKYLSVTSRQSNPTDVGKDDAGRAMVVFNIDAEKQPS